MIDNKFELLELAAKAAGIEVFRGPFGSNQHDSNTLYRKNPKGDYYNGIEWDPLTYDGDALRLAVYLFRDIHFWYFDNSVSVGNEQRVLCGDDPCAATRLAIVRAAAEAGREMP